MEEHQKEVWSEPPSDRTLQVEAPLPAPHPPGLISFAWLYEYVYGYLDDSGGTGDG